MSFESLLATCQKSNASLETLAAIGAELRARRDGLSIDPEIRRLLQAIACGADPGFGEDLSEGQKSIILGFIDAFFRQAADLLANPARPPGWSYDDPAVLDAQGRGSKVIVRSIASLAVRRPSLARALAEPGCFLDVGTGTGWLAIEAAATWPQMRVIGIDPWEPSLRLARANAAASGFGDRIDFRLQGIEAFDGAGQCTLIWYSGPFIQREVTENAFPRLSAAMKPGGTLVFGLYAPAPTPQGELLNELKIRRSGGYPWRPADIASRLVSSGFTEVETVETGTPALFVVARKPAT